MPTTPPKSNFDLELDFGEMWESTVCRMLEGEGSVEVKADKMWAKTGNLAFEYGRYDMSIDDIIRTGFMATNAHWWCNVLVSPVDTSKSLGIRIWEVHRLKYMIKHLLSQGRAWTHTMSGDGGRTSLVLVPLDCLQENRLFDYELSLEQDYKIIRRRKAFQEEWDSSKEERELWEIIRFDID